MYNMKPASALQTGHLFLQRSPRSSIAYRFRSRRKTRRLPQNVQCCNFGTLGTRLCQRLSLRRFLQSYCNNLRLSP
jgi:hypothetical protein